MLASLSVLKVASCVGWKLLNRLRVTEPFALRVGSRPAIACGRFSRIACRLAAAAARVGLLAAAVS